MNVLILDEVNPIKPLFRGIPPWAFADHVADLNHIF